jgi:hypothetical protein
MIDRSTLRQIAEAVECQGGDLADVQDLVSCWERMQERLRHANALCVAGNEQAAEAVWQKLDAEFAKPLEDVVREHRRGRKP